ncbi:MAG: FAD:protein FMN transferase [Elusimicrobia bacterium]|nr:FAD:protein FMN transferase [Elusimicrobiota bacterium]
MINIKKIYLIFGIFLAGCSVGSKEFSYSKILIGTTVEIKVIANNEASAKESIYSAFNEIARIEDTFSVYKPYSEVSMLNKKGSEIVSDEVIRLVKKANHFSEISEGVFDITVLPVINLWKYCAKMGIKPRKQKIEDTRKLVGWQNVLIDEKNRRISFRKKGMKIDLGGIAKGYAVDRAVGVLKESGINTGMVNAGGDIRCFGKKIWKIALQNPRSKKDYITVLKVKDKSITTSGDYERYFLLDKEKISHIINPLTGHSAEKSISSTIIAENATDADALATITFVLGPEKASGFIKNLKNTEYLIIDKERRIYKSPGFSKYE